MYKDFDVKERRRKEDGKKEGRKGGQEILDSGPGFCM